jgi:hypothetical protein
MRYMVTIYKLLVMIIKDSGNRPSSASIKPSSLLWLFFMPGLSDLSVDAN